jgi:hypothetical protein
MTRRRFVALLAAAPCAGLLPAASADVCKPAAGPPFAAALANPWFPHLRPPFVILESTANGVGQFWREPRGRSPRSRRRTTATCSMALPG